MPPKPAKAIRVVESMIRFDGSDAAGLLPPPPHAASVHAQTTALARRAQGERRAVPGISATVTAAPGTPLTFTDF